VGQELAKSNLPVELDGFDLADADEFVGATFLKFADKEWTDRNGEVISPGPYAVVDISKEALCWRNKKIVNRIPVEPGKGIDIEELNARESDWEPNPFGDPKGPWVLTYAVCMICPETGARFISSNSTVGQSAAFYALRSQVRWKRKIVGEHVTALVNLSSSLMRTKFGLKPRPAFDIVGWTNLGAPEGAPAIAGPTGPVASPTSAEIIKDSIPDASTSAVTGAFLGTILSAI
jgi:hypothetical protein